jgi:hypothetical protein
LEARYDAMLRDMGGKPSTVDSIIQIVLFAFTARVMSHPVPGRFKVPLVKPYDRTGDPIGHLKSYKAHVDLHETMDEIPLTSEGSAQEWFGGLPANSIDNFESLTKIFLLQFLIGKKRKNTLQYMLALRQRETKSLKGYLQRFNKERVEAEDMLESVVLTVAINGLWHKGPFILELAKKTPTTLQEFMEKLEEFISQEEMMRMYAGREAKPNEQIKKKEPHKGEGASSQWKSSKKSSKRLKKGKPLTEQEFKFTPMNASVVEVFMQIPHDRGLKRPEKMRAPPEKWNMNKYCDYHQDHGHETEDCVSLRIEIERMIKGGKLARFVAANQHMKYDKPHVKQRYHDKARTYDDSRRPATPPRRQGCADDYRANSEARHRRANSEVGRHDDRNVRRRAEPERRREPVGEIHTIVGGFAASGSSSSGRRAYAKRLPL